MSSSTYTKLLLVVTAVFFMACGRHKNVIVLKLAHGLDPSHPVNKAMVYMGQELQKESHGKMKIEIYPSGQLGDEQQCVELLQIGSLAITKVSAATLESFTPNYQILGLPYIFRSREHHYKTLDSPIGDDFLNSTDKFNIKGLCFYDAGFRSFYTINKPIRTPADLKGQKIRVMKSFTDMNMVKAFGGSPTPISWGELYTALQSGVVDGAENNLPSLQSSHHYDVCKYYSLTEHTCIPDVVIISTIVWNKLNKQEQGWLRAAAKKSVIKERELWQKAEKEALKTIKKAGVKIIIPDKKLFMKKVEPMYEAYKSQPEMYKLIQRIRNIK